MNGTPPNNPGLPTQINSPYATPPPPLRSVPLGELPEDREPIANPLNAVEAILRHPRRVIYHLHQPGAGGLTAGMLFVTIVCCLVYGVVVGSFSMGDQLWAAPAKVTLGLLISAIICLPSLYIFTCLSGSQARLAEIFGLVAGLLMLMTTLLVGFAPVAWLFSQSTDSLVWMGTLHLVFWLVSTAFALRFLNAGFSHTRARSSAGLNTWIVIFMLVVLQMTTALRPIIGKSPSFLPKDKKFFLSHWGDNLSEASKSTPESHN
jgi:hypothetical protein